jgi:hypothetical protein
MCVVSTDALGSAVHPVPTGSFSSGTERMISMVNPRPFLDLLAATVELAAARSILRELIRLADQVPGLTDEQLRFRLLALAECAIPGHSLSPDLRLAAG